MTAHAEKVVSNGNAERNVTNSSHAHKDSFVIVEFASLDADPITIAQSLNLALIGNVKTLVEKMFAERMRCAKCQIIERFVCVQMGSEEKQNKGVLHTNAQLMKTVSLTNCAMQMELAGTLAWNKVSVELMLNVELSIVKHSVLALQVTLVIQGLSVRSREVMNV